jgi:hypothetical protein
VAPVRGHERRASGTAWALSFLTTLASVVFAMAAISGWVLGAWPANPLTLLVAAVVVVGGPGLALLFRGSTRPVAPAPARVSLPAPVPASRPARPLVLATPAPRLPPLTVEQAYARELLDWRDRPLPR